MTASTDQILACRDAYLADEQVDRAVERDVVKTLASTLAHDAPGNSVEVRVPPYVAFQVVAGTRHRRGTPPATVECSPATFVLLATGSLAWSAAIEAGRLRASGERSDLRALFPLRY